MGYNVHESASWWEITQGSSSSTTTSTTKDRGGKREGGGKGGATRLLERCKFVFGWTDEYAYKVLCGYREFLDCKMLLPEGIAIPSVPINRMWQQHVLDTQNYENDCIVLTGQVLHYPIDDNGIDTTSTITGVGGSSSTKTINQRIADTRALLCKRKNCKLNELDQQVWNFPPPPTISLPPSARKIKKPNNNNKNWANMSVDEIDPRPRTRIKFCHNSSSSSSSTPTTSTTTTSSNNNDQVSIAIIWNCDGDDSNEKKKKVVESNFLISNTIQLNKIFNVYAKQRQIERESLSFLLLLDDDNHHKTTTKTLEGKETSKDLLLLVEDTTGMIQDGKKKKQDLCIICEPKLWEC